ncbi:MAG TPA: HEAT repeat domain-containing protein [Polyangia bacterium]
MTRKSKQSILWPVALLLLGPSAVHAGTGSSPEAIRSAIASNSVDAISAELERAERLRCGSCVQDVRPLVDHADARVRRVAAWWLSRRGLRNDLFIEMAVRLGQPDSRRAEAAADVLGSLRHPLSAEPLGAALLNPAFDVPARIAMAAALGRIGSEEARAPLRTATADPEARVRAAALTGLRALRGPIEADLSIDKLADSDEAVRIEAIYTLGAGRGLGLSEATRARGTTALVRLLANDKSPRVRRKAAWAIGEIRSTATAAAAPLGTAIKRDTDASVRSLAHAALSKLSR